VLFFFCVILNLEFRVFFFFFFLIWWIWWGEFRAYGSRRGEVDNLSCLCCGIFK
jgi:hypothetical protein